MNNIHTSYDEIELTDGPHGVTVSINGKNLIDMLRDYEKPFTEKEDPSPKPGGYMPVLNTSFLTKSFISDDDDDLLLFRCSDCGEDGCWPMVVKVSGDEDSVVWSDFLQPHRDKSSRNYWDYSHFGPFRFKIDAYSDQLSAIKN